MTDFLDFLLSESSSKIRPKGNWNVKGEARSWRAPLPGDFEQIVW
jgi:hypothetical protein